MDRNYCAAQREAIGRKPRTAEPKWRCIRSIFSYSKFLEYERGIKCCRMLQFKKHCVLVFFVGSSRRLNNKALFIDWKLLGFFFCCVCTFHVLFKHFGWSFFFFAVEFIFDIVTYFPNETRVFFYCCFFFCCSYVVGWQFLIAVRLKLNEREQLAQPFCQLTLSDFFSQYSDQIKNVCSIINLFNYRQCCRI